MPTPPDTPPSRVSPAIGEFLNPKSMLTPGLCGGVTMLISNTLAAQFQVAQNVSGLAISLLFGLVVFKAAGTALWLRGAYWILNSLIIFSIALGTNQVGVRTTSAAEITPAGPAPVSATPPQPGVGEARSTAPSSPLFTNWLDGTVRKREELLTRVQRIEPAKATSALKSLGVDQPSDASSQKYLGQWVANARTVHELATFEKALKTTEGM